MNPLIQRTQVIDAIEVLSDESIDELVRFIDYLQYKASNSRSLLREDSDIIDPNKIYEVWTPILSQWTGIQSIYEVNYLTHAAVLK